jgi:ComF family protein
MIALRHPRTWPLWDVLFPPLCAVCSRPLGDSLLYCPQCWADAPLVEGDEMPKLRHVDLARAGYRFGGDDVVKAAVHALKYDRLRLIAREMATHLVACLPLRFVESEIVWTPVPLHWSRRMNRGFNQSSLIAEELAPMVRHAKPLYLLKRIRNTPTQTALTHRERAANMKDAFRVVAQPPLPKSVLLIDDVITTGATMNECAHTLKAAGVEWVGALAFAKSTHR